MSTEPRYTFCVISSDDLTVSRVLLGDSVGGLNRGVTTSQQGLLLPASPQTTLPALTARVYFKAENGTVTEVIPTPSILWELSCGSHQATIDQSGVITRHSNPDDQAFNSNGAATSSGSDNAGIGGLVQVSATVLRADGSKSGVRGLLNVTIQNCAARQGATGTFHGADNAPASAKGYFNLVDPVEGDY